MGAGMGPKFGNSFGARNKSDDFDTGNAQNTVKLPSNDSQINHIFASRAGHLPNTIENRAKILRVANNPNAYSGQDKYGNNWYTETQADGSQIWVKVHGKTVSNAGINKTPREWDNESGYDKNPKNTKKWRKRK